MRCENLLGSASERCPFPLRGAEAVGAVWVWQKLLDIQDQHTLVPVGTGNNHLALGI